MLFFSVASADNKERPREMCGKSGGFGGREKFEGQLQIHSEKQ